MTAFREQVTVSPELHEGWPALRFETQRGEVRKHTDGVDSRVIKFEPRDTIIICVALLRLARQAMGRDELREIVDAIPIGGGE